MLLSIKSIAALSIVPLSLAKHYSEKTEQANICNLVGEFDRLNFTSIPVTTIRRSDAVQSNLTPFSNYCPTIQGQVGTPVCETAFIVSPIPSSTLLVQTSNCPNIAPANELVSNTNMYGCFTYYHFSGTPPFNCASGTFLCRYCALQDYAPELSRNFVYTPNTLTTLLTYPVVPFRCGAPKCPAFTVVPNTNPTKYVRLSAAYCVLSNFTTSQTPYAGLTQNYACGTGLNQIAVNQKWGCYIGIDIPTLYPGSTNGTWCDAGFSAVCFYDLNKPYSYPPLA